MAAIDTLKEQDRDPILRLDAEILSGCNIPGTASLEDVLIAVQRTVAHQQVFNAHLRGSEGGMDLATFGFVLVDQGLRTAVEMLDTFVPRNDGEGWGLVIAELAEAYTEAGVDFADEVSL